MPQCGYSYTLCLNARRNDDEFSLTLHLISNNSEIAHTEIVYEKDIYTAIEDHCTLRTRRLYFFLFFFFFNAKYNKLSRFVDGCKGVCENL